MKPHPRIRKTIKWLCLGVYWPWFGWWLLHSPHPGTVWERQLQMLPMFAVGLVGCIAWSLDVRARQREKPAV